MGLFNLTIWMNEYYMIHTNTHSRIKGSSFIIIFYDQKKESLPWQFVGARYYYHAL